MTSAFLRQDIERDEGCVLGAYPDPLSALAVALRHARIPAIHYNRLPGWQKLSGAPWTIGTGHTGREVHPGLVWTQAQADDQVARDIGLVCRGMDTALSWWRTLSDPRQDVLANMAFNMGVAGLLGWPTTLGEIRAGDYAGAADHLLWKIPPKNGAPGVPTRWSVQVGPRAKRLSDELRTGVRIA